MIEMPWEEIRKTPEDLNLLVFLNRYITDEGGHWIWTGPVEEHTGLPRYGLSIRGGKGKTRTLQVRREMMRLVGWVMTRHVKCIGTCDEPRCVRPDHTVLVLDSELSILSHPRYRELTLADIRENY